MLRYHQQPSRCRRHRRSGHLYLAVMTVSTLVGIIGVSAITVARAKLRDTQDERDRYEARILALSAIENGLAAINKNSLWRTTYSIGIEFPATAHSLGNGTISCELVDPDGDLTDDSSDSAYLYGIGRVGDAVQVRRVEIEPAGGSGEMKITIGSWQDTDAL